MSTTKQTTLTTNTCLSCNAPLLSGEPHGLLARCADCTAEGDAIRGPLYNFQLAELRGRHATRCRSYGWTAEAMIARCEAYDDAREDG